jgi:hypothetical protein
VRAVYDGDLCAVAAAPVSPSLIHISQFAYWCIHLLKEKNLEALIMTLVALFELGDCKDHCPGTPRQKVSDIPPQAISQAW